MQKLSMRNIFTILLLLLIAGWALRVGIPYRNAQSHVQEDLERERIINTLLGRLYASANTNNGKFPPSLQMLGPINGPNGLPIDMSKYLLNTNALPNEKMDGERLVVAEVPSRFRTGLYYAGAEGQVVVSWSQPKYNALLSKNLLTDPKLLQMR